MTIGWLQRSLALSVLLVSGCDSSPVAPSTSAPSTPPPPGAIVCPASISRQSIDGRALQITYGPPTVDARPLEKGVCSPVSGSSFPAGASTRVTCRATEAPDLANACSFTISISIPAQIAKTKFMAFGDSITDGFLLCDPCPGTLQPGWKRQVYTSPLGWRLLGPFVHPQPEKSYPFLLQQLLAAKYTIQQITVLNRGLTGEKSSQGRERLPGELMTYAPEVLLLFEGINDINLAIIAAEEEDETISVLPIKDDLRAMIMAARDRGVEVILATLTPIGEAWEENYPGASDAVIRLNQEIRLLALEFNLGSVVDLHSALGGDPSLMSEDGLHPTAAGYRRIADLFFQIIMTRYDSTPRPRPALTEP